MWVWGLLLVPLCVLLFIACHFSTKAQSHDFFRAQYVNKANEIHRSKRTPKKGGTPDKGLQRKVSFGSCDELMSASLSAEQPSARRKLFDDDDSPFGVPLSPLSPRSSPDSCKEPPESILVQRTQSSS